MLSASVSPMEENESEMEERDMNKNSNSGIENVNFYEGIFHENSLISIIIFFLATNLYCNRQII